MQGVSFVDVMTAVAIALRFAGVGLYLFAIHRGKMPSLTSWFVWTIAQFVAVSAQWSEVPKKVSLSVWLTTLGIASGSLLIVLMTAWKKDFRSNFVKFDFVHFFKSNFDNFVYVAFAAGGIIGWKYLDSPLFAVLCCAGADLAGGIPTILKGWRNPTSEPLTTFSLFLGAAILSLVTAAATVPRHERTWVAFTLPVYFIIVNLTMVLILKLRKPPVPDQSQSTLKTSALVE